MKTVFTTVFGILMLVFAGSSYAVSVFECEDDQGNKSFYDRCPPGTTAVNEKKFNVQTEKEPPQISATLYFVPKCGACDQAREFFQLRKISLVEKNVDNNVELQNELAAKAGELKVPTVIINDKVISGYNRSEMISALEAAGISEPEDQSETTEAATTPPPPPPGPEPGSEATEEPPAE